MLIGSRTPEKHTKLLWKGYFSNGKQRITDEAVEGQWLPVIRLWDDWELRQSHIYAADIATLLEVARLDISDWLWHSNREG